MNTRISLKTAATFVALLMLLPTALGQSAPKSGSKQTKGSSTSAHSKWTPKHKGPGASTAKRKVRKPRRLLGTGYVPVTAAGGGGLRAATRLGDEGFLEYEIQANQSGVNHTFLRNPYKDETEVKAEAFFQPVGTTGVISSNWSPLPDFKVVPARRTNDLKWTFRSTGWTLDASGSEKDYWVMVVVHSNGSRNTCVGAHIYRYHCIP